MAAVMAVDVKSTGRVHPVVSWSTVIFGVAFTRIFVAQSEGWLRIGRAIIAPFLRPQRVRIASTDHCP